MTTGRYNALPKELADQITKSAKAVSHASARCIGAAHRRKISAAGLSGLAAAEYDNFEIETKDDQPAPDAPVAKPAKAG